MFLSVLWLQLVRMISNILIVSNGPATLLESCSCSFEVSILFPPPPPKLNTTFMIMPLVEVGIGFQFQYNPSALKDSHLIPIGYNISNERSSFCQTGIGSRRKRSV